MRPIYLFKQYVLKEEIALLDAYNQLSEFLENKSNVIIADRCNIVYSHGVVFHTEYVDMLETSYIIVNNLKDLKLLQTIQHNHKIIFICEELPVIKNKNIFCINGAQDIISIGYEIKEVIYGKLQ
jgi:Ni,Fe-hydrogenase maturation factor